MKKKDTTMVWLRVGLCVSLSMSCAQEPARPDSAEPFRLEEPGAADEHEGKTRGSGEPRREFAPGELAWVKPDHRVVVHLFEEADAAKEAHAPCCEDRQEWNYYANYGIRIIDGESFHSMHFPPRKTLGERAEGKARALLQDKTLGSLQGVYLPEEMALDDAPTLHLFQCPADGVKRYDLGDIHVSCGGEEIVWPEVTVGSEAGRWLVCERERLWRTYIFGNGHPGSGNRFTTRQPPDWCQGKLEQAPKKSWDGVVIFADHVEAASRDQVVPFLTFPNGVQPLLDPFARPGDWVQVPRTGPEIPHMGILLGYYSFTRSKEATLR